MFSISNPAEVNRKKNTPVIRLPLPIYRLIDVHLALNSQIDRSGQIGQPFELPAESMSRQEITWRTETS
jgi:hypothetical protein